MTYEKKQKRKIGLILLTGIKGIKKRNIAVIGLWLLKGVTLWLPDLLNVEQVEWFKEGFNTILTVGTLHSMLRTNTAKNVTDKLIKTKK